MHDIFATLPDWIKLAWYAVCNWWHAAVLAWIDRFLAARHEERAPVPLDFEELPVLYNEADIPVLFDKAGGFAQNPWPETSAPIDYDDSNVVR